MRVLVCGGRHYSNAAHVSTTLNGIYGNHDDIDLVIHGGATGADSLAQDWADHHGIECMVFRPDWKAFGTSAGPRRNQLMIDEGKPDLVVAFPGGAGTADMVRRATHAGVEVINVPAWFTGVG